MSTALIFLFGAYVYSANGWGMVFAVAATVIIVRVVLPYYGVEWVFFDPYRPE